MDIAKEHPEKWVFSDLRTEFLNPNSSFQDDRNVKVKRMIWHVVSYVAL
jgi:hypothetical protein